MPASVRPADPGDRELLRQLLFDYLLEFDGSTGPYPYLDAIWSRIDCLS